MPKRYDLEKFSNATNLQNGKALEFIMRDVIDGMEELANMSGFEPHAGNCMEILGVEDPKDFVDNTETNRPENKPNSAEIIPLKRKKNVAA